MAACSRTKAAIRTAPRSGRGGAASGNFIDGGQAKAFVENANAAPSTAPADAAIGAGIGGGGVAGTLRDLQNQLSPMSYGSEFIMRVVLVLAVISAVLLMGGAGYRWCANRKSKHLAAALGGEAPA
ncbi:hypothetical protein FJW08_32185 [Mesorhizobium sp. B3-2-1]|uniref:hypothetical protein n=1 Tax=unclassified Mesorhizobium TaxID=325217 RepID=UPI001125F9EA|nr:MULTISPECIES: hypothetical protein [unclassified Mesorhizobium]MBZ9711631.1 hypothetical protein [Mesorhizobium sp. ESP7-2]TPI19238.1 hypothetical protein FJW08_32185 [Mesorhizobium sp. B3-2-1]